MPNIDAIIKTRLFELCPQLVLNGFDRIVWQWCKRDMAVYLQYLKNSGEKFGNQIKYINVIYFGRVLNNLSSLSSLQIMGDEYEKEAIEWFHMWIGKWWRKFQQRVILQLSLQTKRTSCVKKKANSGQLIWENKFTQDEREFIFKNAIRTLLNNDEVIRPDILVRQTIFIKLSHAKKDKEWKIEDIINFDISLRKDLKLLSRSSGKLLFVFPSKHSYIEN